MLNLGRKIEPRTVKIPRTTMGVAEVVIPGPYTSWEALPARVREGYFSPENQELFHSKPDCLMYGRFIIDSTESLATPNTRRWHVMLVDDNGLTFIVAAPPLDWNGEPGTDAQYRFESAAVARRMLERLVGEYTLWADEAIDVDMPPVPNIWHATLKSGRGDEASPNTIGQSRQEAIDRLLGELREMDAEELIQEGRVPPNAEGDMPDVMGANQ